jgi:hypothetical protein
MSNQIKNILKEASATLETLQNGKTYPVRYVIDRLNKASEDYPTDQLIGNMRDVLQKVASQKDLISQKEIGNLYDKMYGLAGGQTGFRQSVGDLLPEDRQFKKVAHPGSSSRTLEEKTLAPIHKESELSNAFSVLFSIGSDSSFGTFKPGQDKSVQKAVISKLSSLGYAPEGVDIVHSNDHFALCSANYKTTAFNKVSTLIPVQITDGVTREPEHVILGGEAVILDRANLFTAIKEAEHDSKNRSNRKFASERGDGTPELQIEKAVVPVSLRELTDLENNLIAAASKFTSNEINMAIATVSAELNSFGIKSSEIKIASSNKDGLTFSVNIPTKLGKSQITVPVEIHNGIVALPSRFASDGGTKEEAVFDFSREGFERFASTLTPGSRSIKIARDSGPLSEMSYQQLMDQMVEGVASKDYKLAEDSLEVIASRFGGNQYLVAFDQYSQLLKHSSEGSKRQQLIKEAFDRGDLIKVPTSVDLYCPKLGLPVSKVTFDEKGRVIPAGRRAKSENQVQDAMISNSRILLT